MANIKSFPNNQDAYIGAEDVMKWLHGRTSGVFASDNNASVSALVNSTMEVQVSDGLGWITNVSGDGVVWWNDHETVNGTKLILAIDPADGVLNRIDRIIVEWKTTNYVDLPEIKVLKGSFASNPVAPSLTNNSTIRQLSLARVNVAAGTTAITASMITDERLDASVCGIVTESASVDTSMANAQFNELLDLIQKNLEQLVSGEIPDKSITREKFADDSIHTAEIVTLTPDGWSNKKQTVNVNDATADNLVLVAPDPDSHTAYADAGIRCIEQDEGILTFECESVPSVEVLVNVTCFVDGEGGEGEGGGGGGGSTVADAVLYIPQELTEEQKEQARENIGATGKNDNCINGVNVKLYGAVGDGEADDTQAFLDAIDAIVNIGGGTLYIPKGEYKMTGPITFYCDKMDVVGDGAILNWGAISDTSYACVRVVTHDSYSNSENPDMYHNNIRLGQLHKCSGVIFKGITDYEVRKYGNLIGVNYEGNIATGAMSVGFNFEHCVFYGFGVAIRCYSNSWVQGFFACNISDNNVAIEITAGGSNYCERVTIVDSNIHSNVVAVKIGHSHAHIHAIGCSFDYNDTICNLTNGRLYLTDCHLESTRNNGSWFDLTGGLLMCKSCEWYASGNNHLGTVSSGAVAHVDGGYFYDDGYTPKDLFTGAGGIYVYNMFPLGVVNSIIPGESSDDDVNVDPDYTELDGSFMVGSYITITGEVMGDGNNHVALYDSFVAVSAGKNYAIDIARADIGTVSLRFYDKNKNFVNGKSYAYSNGIFTVPDGCSYLRFGLADTVSGTDFVTNPIYASDCTITERVEGDVLSVVGATMTRNKYINYVDGKFLDGSGGLSAVQEFVPVEPGASYRLSTTSTAKDLSINMCFYDAEKGYTYDGDSTSSDLNVKAGSYSLLKKTMPLDFVVPADCYFLRFHSSKITKITEWTLIKLDN